MGAVSAFITEELLHLTASKTSPIIIYNVNYN